MVKRKSEEVDWTEYFHRIRGECPWSGANHYAGLIDFVNYEDGVEPLGHFTARVYEIHGYSPRRMKLLCDKLMATRPGETWLYSHPRYTDLSTPVPALIQQSTETLEAIRRRRDK